MLERNASAAVARSSPSLETGVLAVAGIFAEVFERNSVGADDDFFALGGDSLIAATLVSEIERSTGVGLSISVLLESPTPRLLAQTIATERRTNSSRILVPVRAAGRGPTVFCIHGMDGESFFPLRFARHFQQDRPICGVRALGLEAGEHATTSIAGLAETYLAAVRLVQPKGPYVLLGHCGVGTMVAWEMAQRLIGAGEAVSGVILIDPTVNQDVVPVLHKTGFALELARAQWTKRSAEVSLWFEENPGVTAKERRKHVSLANRVAAATYSPRKLSCAGLLIFTPNRKRYLLDDDHGYRNLLDGFEFVEIDVEHMDLLDSRLDDVMKVVVPFLDRVAPLS